MGPGRPGDPQGIIDDQQPGGEDSDPAEQRARDGVDPQAVEQAVGPLGDRTHLVDLAADLTRGQEVHRDVEEHSGGEPEDGGVQGGQARHRQQRHRDGGDADRCRRQQQRRDGFAGLPEAVGGGVARGALVRDDRQPEQEDGRTRDHRAAGEPVAPHESPRVGTRNDSAERGRPRNPDRRDPPHRLIVAVCPSVRPERDRTVPHSFGNRLKPSDP